MTLADVAIHVESTQLRRRRGRPPGLHAPARPVRPPVEDAVCRRRGAGLLSRCGSRSTCSPTTRPTRRARTGSGPGSSRRWPQRLTDGRGAPPAGQPAVPADAPGLRAGGPLHHLPVVERAPAAAHAERAALRAGAAAAGQDRRLQHADRPAGPARAGRRGALQDHARLHRARGDLQPWSGAYRQHEPTRTRRKVADAIIINSESLRAEVQRYLDVDPGQAAPDPRGGRPRPVPPRRPRRGAGPRSADGTASTGRSCSSSPRCGRYKNCDGLLRAFAAARPTSATTSWWWSGPAGTRSTSPSCTPWPRSWASPTTWSGSAACRWRRRVHFYRAADVFVYPSFNETFGLPILEAMACGCPVVTSDTQRDARDGRRRRAAGRPRRPGRRSPTRIVEACGPEGERLRRLGPERAAEFTWAAHRGELTLDVYREVHRARGKARTMRILVTGGAGFIGSHTCDRLVELGHDVIVLDALTAPVHRDGRPNYLTPGAELFVGDVRNRELLRQPAAPSRRGLPLRRLPGLPDRLRPVHRRQRDARRR